MRSLQGLLNDYLRLKGQQDRRLALAGRSTLALRLLEALDCEAGVQQQQVTAAAAAAAQQQQAVAAAAAVQQQEQVPANHALQMQAQGQLATAFVPVQQQGGGYAAMYSMQPPALLHQQLQPLGLDADAAAANELPQAHAITPSRHRKGAPPKRRRTGEGGAGGVAPPEQGGGAGAGLFSGGGGGVWGSPMDLLSLPLDAGGLEALLDDGPLQVRHGAGAGSRAMEDWRVHFGCRGGSSLDAPLLLLLLPLNAPAARIRGAPCPAHQHHGPRRPPAPCCRRHGCRQRCRRRCRRAARRHA